MRIANLSFVALLLILAGGCESTTPSATATASHVMGAGPQRAIIVSGGNGGSTTVFLPSDDPEHPIMLSTTGAEMCPNCKSAAVKYFETGVLEPKCPRCGATRTLVVPSTPNVGHQ